MQQFAATLRERIVQVRLELEAARHRGDGEGVSLNERRLRYLTGAAAEYGIAVGLPILRQSGRFGAPESKE